MSKEFLEVIVPIVLVLMVVYAALKMFNRFNMTSEDYRAQGIALMAQAANETSPKRAARLKQQAEANLQMAEWMDER